MEAPFENLNTRGAVANLDKDQSSYFTNRSYLPFSVKVNTTNPVDFTIEMFGIIDYSVDCARVRPSNVAYL